MVTSRRLVATGRGLLLVLALLATLARPLHANVDGHLTKRYSDQSVHGYKTEVTLSFLSLTLSPVHGNPYSSYLQRTCYWNEVCKEEFQNLFRCKCPQFSYCR